MNPRKSNTLFLDVVVTVMCLLLKKHPESFVNKATHAVVCIPFCAFLHTDTDEKGNPISDTTWFRTVNVADIDYSRTFSSELYHGFQDPGEFILARKMFWKLIGEWNIQGTCPRWLSRGLNPPYLATVEKNQILKETEHQGEVILESEDDDRKRKRNKTKTYDPQEVMEEENTKRARTSKTKHSKSTRLSRTTREPEEYEYDSDFLEETHAVIPKGKTACFFTPII